MSSRLGLPKEKVIKPRLNSDPHKCIITGLETKDKTKNYPIHKSARLIIKKAKQIQKVNLAVEANDGVKNLMDKGIVPKDYKMYQPKDFKLSDKAVIEMYKNGENINKKNNLPKVFIPEDKPVSSEKVETDEK